MHTHRIHNIHSYCQILAGLLSVAISIVHAYSNMPARKREDRIDQAAAATVVQEFQHVLPVKCTVLRDGKWKQVETTHCVIGDIVSLKTGGKVPADLRVVECTDMRVNNTLLSKSDIQFVSDSGAESEPGGVDLVLNSITSVPNDTSDLLLSSNMALYGSTVVTGYGKGVVVCRNHDTVLGKIILKRLGRDPDSEPNNTVKASQANIDNMLNQRSRSSA
jgi:magnesium-transporting ATPase (P-type)